MATLVEPHSMIDPLYGSYYNYSSANVSLSGTPAAADGPMSHMAYGCQCCSCQSHHFELRKSSIVEHVQKMNYLYHHHQQQQQQHYHYHHHLQQQKYRHYLRPSPAQNIESSSSLIARKREHASITDAKKESQGLKRNKLAHNDDRCWITPPSSTAHRRVTPNYKQQQQLMHSHHHHPSATEFSHHIFESSSLSGRYPHHHHQQRHQHPCFAPRDALCDNSSSRPLTTLFPPPPLTSLLPAEDGGCNCESCLYISSCLARSDHVYLPDHVHQFSGSSSFTVSPDSQCSVYATGAGSNVDHYLYLNRMDDLQLAYNQAYFAQEEVGDSAEQAVYLDKPTRRIRRRVQSCSRSSSLTRSSPRKAVLAEDHKRQAQGLDCSRRHSARVQFTAWIAALSLDGAHLLELVLHIYQRVCRLRKQDHSRDPADLRDDDPSLDLACCLWIASKLEERQVNVPSAAEVATVAKIETKALATREIELMVLMDWRPLKDWIAPGRKEKISGHCC